MRRREKNKKEKEKKPWINLSKAKVKKLREFMGCISYKG